MLGTNFTQKVAIKSPFRFGKKSFFIKSYLYSNEGTYNWLQKKFVRNPARHLFRTLMRLRVPLRGKFYFKQNGQETAISFNEKNTQFHSIYKSKYRLGYELETLALLNLFSEVHKEGFSFIDVGCNWGYFPMHVASINPSARAYAFEPVPQSFKDLKEVVSQANLNDRITCYSAALSNKSGPAHMRSGTKYHSGYCKISSKGKRSFEVELKKLDDFNISNPSVVKVDVEGHEVQVLEGASETLAQFKPMVIFESMKEMHDAKNTVKPFEVLQSLGYLFFYPVILSKINGQSYGFGYDNYKEVESEQPGSVELALYELNPKTRLLLEKQVNVLACHQDKLFLLERAFSPNEAKA